MNEYIKNIIEATSMGKLEKEAVLNSLLNLHSVSGSKLYTADQVKELIQECCGEVYCEDGVLKGKSPTELYKWIEGKEL